MKKTIAFLLAGCLLASLAACSPAADPLEDSGSSSISDTKEPENSTISESSKPVQESISNFNTTGTIEETVIYEQNEVKITATKLEYTLDQITVYLTIENDSTKDLSFSSGTMGYSCNAVNGIMVDDGYMNCDVAAGKTANETITFATQELLLYGIDCVANLQLGFTITDADYNSIYTTPMVLQTSLGESYQQPMDSIQTAVQNEALQSQLGYTIPFFQAGNFYNQHGVKVESAGVMEKSSGEQMLLLEVVNSGEQPICFVTSDIVFNGVAVYGYNWSSDEILPGARRLVYLNVENVFNREFWSAYGLEPLTSVNMNVALDDQEGNPLAEETPLQIQLSNTESPVDTQGIEAYNEGGIRVLSKELVVDEMGDFSVLLLVENTSGQTVKVSMGYDSLSIGGVMNDATCYDQTIPDGGRGALVIELQDLEENGIASVEDITDMELQLQIRSEESYETMAEPKVTLNFAGGDAV